MKKLKIGYFADGPWSHAALDKILLDNTLKVLFICARNDIPDNILRQRCQELDIPFITHPKINSDEFLELMLEYKCDLFVSMSFNQIFKHDLINLPPHKTINCHAGKLPFYRGRNILNWALINDEKDFGITIHYVDSGIDTGDIILQNIYNITDADDYATILNKAYTGCATTLYEAIKKIQSNDINLIIQKNIHPLGMYCTARREGDEVLDWNQTSREIFNFVRAICRPGPEARTYLNGHEIKLNKIEFLPNAPSYKGIIGAVVGVESNGFYVKTADSYIKVVDWCNYEKPRIGDRLK
jgi:methionyl-tRNA formyltransferase